MSLPEAEPWQDGATFLVKAHAGAKRDRVGGIHDGMLKVEVTTAPEKGKANKAILKLLAKWLGTAPAGLELLAGDTNPKKRVGVHGMTPDAVTAKLRQEA